MAGSATEGVSTLTDADFRFDSIISSDAASTRTDACFVSAHCETRRTGSKMPVPARMQGWAVRARVGHALLVNAYCGHPGVATALHRQQ